MFAQGGNETHLRTQHIGISIRLECLQLWTAYLLRNEIYKHTSRKMIIKIIIHCISLYFMLIYNLAFYSPYYTIAWYSRKLKIMWVFIIKLYYFDRYLKLLLIDMPSISLTISDFPLFTKSLCADRAPRDPWVEISEWPRNNIIYWEKSNLFLIISSLYKLCQQF